MDKLDRLEELHMEADVFSDGMKKVVCRAAAKVPIVKCWDPELELAMDLNVNNPLALQNTRLIKTYVQVDDRVRPLAKIIKHWTKQRVLNDAGMIGLDPINTLLDPDFSYSIRRHHQLVYMDMYGHQLPATTETSHTAVPADDEWPTACAAPRRTRLGIRRRPREAERLWRRE